MKKIARAEILGAITDKFTLQEYERENFLFSEMVFPTYDVGQHVKDWQVKRYRVSVAANGLVVGMNVPQTEQWKIRRLTVIHETGANFDIDQIVHYNTKTSTAMDYIFYDTTSPLQSGAVAIFEFPQDITLEYNDRISFNVANYVAGGYVALHTLQEVERTR